MSERPENPFEPRLGRIRSRGNMGRAKSLFSRVSRSMNRAGPLPGRGRGSKAPRPSRTYGRRVVVKARVVRHAASSVAALKKHLAYISRDSAVRESDHGRIFDGIEDDAHPGDFADAAKSDRHHFRFIVSPEDGHEIADMRGFVRKLVSTMENDLETKLEWVAAVHDDTEHPHAHIVVRGKRSDGQDLVLPRNYIAHGIRARAEELVYRELGPQTQLEKDVKRARQTGAEYLTEIDRSLKRMADQDGAVNLDDAPLKYRPTNSARLKTLERLGLAQQVSGSNWLLAQGFDRTLKEVGERRNIIKQLHRALGDRQGRTVRPDVDLAMPITGRILRTGMKGEGHDEPYLVLDTIEGEAILVRADLEVGDTKLRPGMIVTAAQKAIAPKPSDRTVQSIAALNNGRYSEDLHRAADPSAKSHFVKAHIRRLEALRRGGIAQRAKDGIWQIPDNFLDRVSAHMVQNAKQAGADINVESWADLNDQVSAHGLTWLDERPSTNLAVRGFGSEVVDAMFERREVLVERGLIEHSGATLQDQARETLRRNGMNVIGANLAKQNGKTYLTAPSHGEIDGTYTKTVQRPEGKFAVIEKQRTVTLVPWRPGMDMARGRTINGTVRGQSISWTIGKGRGGR